MAESAERIRRLLGSAGLAPLFAEVRRRWEREGVERVRSVSLRDPSRDTRRALADLHGWDRLPRGVVKVTLAQLDATLIERGLGGLRAVIEALGGPLVDRRAERDHRETAERTMWSRAAGHPAVASAPALADWLVALRRSGGLTRASRAAGVEPEVLLGSLLDAVARLPAPGVPLSVFATQATGDAHALDVGSPLGNLVLGAAARLVGAESVPRSSRGRRQLWAAVGVLCDPLSATVLVHGLRPSGSDRLSRHLRDSAAAGEPSVLTLRELAGAGLAVGADAPIYVCENPGVVAAVADELGAASAALVCVGGVPSTAGLELLSQLGDSGGDVKFHADFDWGGLRIGNQLAGVLGARPWRFSASDYLSVVDRATVALAEGGGEAGWDPELGGAMRRAGRAVYEEAVVDLLIEDLRRA